VQCLLALPPTSLHTLGLSGAPMCTDSWPQPARLALRENILGYPGHLAEISGIRRKSRILRTTPGIRWIGERSWNHLEDTPLLDGLERIVEGSGSVLGLPSTASLAAFTWGEGSSVASLHLGSQTEPINTVGCVAIFLRPQCQVTSHLPPSGSAPHLPPLPPLAVPSTSASHPERGISQ